MKKFFTLLCMALLSAAGFAQDEFIASEHSAIVRGTKNMCTENWTDDNGPGEAMEYDEGDQVWKITLAAKDTKVIEFKIVYDGTWYGVDGGNANYQFQVTEPSDVLITFDHNTLKATYSGDKVIEYDPNRIEFVVAAGSSALLNGQDWNVEAEENKMTEEDDGYYQLVLNDVKAGTYNFKFAANGAWATQWGAVSGQGTLENNVSVPAEKENGGDFTLVLPKGATYKVTLTLDIMNPSNPMVTAAWEKAGDDVITEDVYSIAGSFNDWDEKDEGAELEKVGEGTYQISHVLPAGDYKFKIVKNHSWAENWPASDYELTLEEDALVTVTFNANEGSIAVALAESPVYFITIKLDTKVEGDIFLYAWSKLGDNTTQLIAGWPGKKLKAPSEGEAIQRVVELPKEESLFIIFNNNNGNQTADIDLGVQSRSCTLEFVLYEDWTWDRATAIQNVEVTKQNGAIYNLAGQRVSKATRGIYIQNGKKFVVK